MNNIVLTQDLMDGFWDKNEETKKIVVLIQEIYNNAEDIIKKLCENFGDDLKQKILYTFIIIYFIENKDTDKIADFKLLIKKGKNFLKKHNINYDIIYKNFLK